MPEWLWIVLVGGVTLGLVALVWSLLTERIRRLEIEIDRLRKWRHELVDAYLPRAVDEHEKRLNRIEPRVFNGDHR